MVKTYGDELNFLTYRLPFGRHTELLLSSERFYNHFLEIKKSGAYINAELVYKELEKMLFPMLFEESAYMFLVDFKTAYLKNHSEEEYKIFRKDRKIFLGGIKRLSEEVYGDERHWEYDYESIYGKPYIALLVARPIRIDDTNKDLEYLLDICSQLPSGSVNQLISQDMVAKEFRKAGKVTDLRSAYEVFAPVFFQCVRLGYKNKPEKKELYYKLRKVASDFCDVLFADKNHWHEDCYEELKKMLFPIADEESRYLHIEDFRAQYVENYGKEAYKTMRRDYYSFKRALSRLSKVLYGDTAHWKEDYEAEYGKPYIEPVIKSRAEIPEENKDLAYLTEICDKLKPSSLEKLLTEESTVEAFRQAGKITDMRHAYEVFAPVFFRCVRLGYKNKPGKSRTYNRLRSVAEDFGDVLFADKQHWHEDYAASEWANKTK